jgi:predicted nucleic acid-binding protein
MTTTRIFLDTNIIVYSRDPASAEKRTKARRWLRFLAERGQAVVNLQVVNEMTDVLLRRSHLGADEVHRYCDELLILGDTPVGRDEMKLAWAIRRRFGFRWWDCLILAAAQILDCSHLLTEDLQHGQSVGTVTIVDPFTTDPETLLSPG